LSSCLRRSSRHWSAGPVWWVRPSYSIATFVGRRPTAGDGLRGRTGDAAGTIDQWQSGGVHAAQDARPPPPSESANGVLWRTLSHPQSGSAQASLPSGPSRSPAGRGATGEPAASPSRVSPTEPGAERARPAGQQSSSGRCILSTVMLSSR
jgi:hypothetical protein